jgi:hypothetical protein
VITRRAQRRRQVGRLPNHHPVAQGIARLLRSWLCQNEADNISDRELRAFKKLGADLLNQPAPIIAALLKSGELVEVPEHAEET